MLLRDLHDALGPKAPLLVPDAFASAEDLVALAGPAATSTYITYYGIPNDRLPPRGRRFLRSFAGSRGGDAGPDLAASFGAQAAEILLDAIARSDGTRASVTDEIRRTRVENGILGDIGFDANGDLVEAPLTVYRVDDEELVVDRVVTVRPPRTAAP
jgi:branched-chain amino acid transport system substrate-binding protein